MMAGGERWIMHDPHNSDNNDKKERETEGGKGNVPCTPGCLEPKPSSDAQTALHALPSDTDSGGVGFF
jgi:hypothetical protein